MACRGAEEPERAVARSARRGASFPVTIYGRFRSLRDVVGTPLMPPARDDRIPTSIVAQMKRCCQISGFLSGLAGY